MSAFDLRVPSFEIARFGRPPHVSDIDRLLANDLFEGVERGFAVRSAPVFRIARLPARALVFERWQVSSVVFLVLNGRVRLERSGASNDVLQLALVERDGFCGEDAFFPGIGRVHRMDARCAGPATLAFARAGDLAPVIEAAPAIALNVARSLSGRLSRLVATIAKTAPLQPERGDLARFDFYSGE